MKTKRVALAVFALIALCALALAFSGCAKEKKGEGLAKVGDKMITEDDMQARLAEMPPYMKQQLSTPDGRKRLLDGLVEEELIYRDALALGLDKGEEYNKELERTKREILMRTYYDKVLEAKAAPSDKEVEEYYNNNKSEFNIAESVTARHILVKTREEAAKIRKELERGARFADLATKYSLDAASKSNGGLISTPVQRGGNIRGLGPLPEFTEAAFQLREGELSQPVKSPKGYHIILAEKRTPESSKSLAEAKADIVSKLTYSKRKIVRAETISQLKSKYKAVYMTEAVSSETKTPEELFKMASEASNPTDKIEHYKQFVQKFPKNERTYEAKFMIGFTMAEELKDYDGAEKVFKEFLEQYPSTDLSDDATWMMENMRSGKHPDLKGN
jgi:peptidyl-prolyl cis-trans isomerase C